MGLFDHGLSRADERLPWRHRSSMSWGCMPAQLVVLRGVRLIGWFETHGVWALVCSRSLPRSDHHLVDFVEEDESAKLPASERSSTLLR